MTIPYNLNIPFSTHNPSVDQPNMLTNTNSIASLVAVDHVAFATAGSGQHNQVTFNANNVPSTPTSPPVLFTNTVGGVPQLFFYSGTTPSQYTNATSGSTYLLGGIILKWGQANLAGGSFTRNVTFATAFPNACFSVVATAIAPTGAVILDAVTNFAVGGFIAVKSSSSSSLLISYIAIGY